MKNERENLTKSYILDAFCKLLETKGYDNFSVCDITEKAGVSRMSFYRNFKSKEDLTKYLLKSLVKKVRQNVEHLDTKNQFTVIKEYFETVKTCKNQILSLMNSQISKLIANTITQNLVDNAPTDQMNKASKYIPLYYFSAISNVLIEWLKGGAIESTDDMSRLICNLNTKNDFPIEIFD